VRPRRQPAVRRLEELVPGRLTACDAGTCFVIDKTLDEFWPGAAAFARRYLDVVAGGKARLQRRRLDPLLVGLTRKSPEGALYFDIETCGFAGTPVFLIGSMRVREGRICLRQFLARDYGEEAAICHEFGRMLADVHTLISFNGKTFDWPFVTDRAALHRLSLPAVPHLDLLHQSRRSFRRIVPDHKLQTLEVFLCNRRRTGDIPGSEIPAAYHDFVRTGHATQMRDILQHNLLDLVTMAELVTFLLADEFPTRE
jgi:uncharacterized protein YprB with RNaseH-like and TPR domain